MERKLVELRLKEVECSEAIKQEEDKMEEIRKEFAPEQKLLTQQRQEIDERQKILNKDMVGNSTTCIPKNPAGKHPQCMWHMYSTSNLLVHCFYVCSDLSLVSAAHKIYQLIQNKLFPSPIPRSSQKNLWWQILAPKSNPLLLQFTENFKLEPLKLEKEILKVISSLGESWDHNYCEFIPIILLIYMC